ncbi:hypothetical protein BCD91_001785 [Clostridium beijerinckii]|nr:hypothetical protein [Clostridium beijerinckii]
MKEGVKAENIIVLENASDYLSDNEFMELYEQLSQYDIHLKSFESHAPKAFLNDITVYISENITELMIAGLFMPTIYDIIKSSMKIIIFKIRGKVKIVQAGKIREAVPCFNFKTKNGEIIAPIPSNLSEEQFERYMDEIKGAIQSIQPNQQTKYQSFVIEQSEKFLKVEVKTMFQYANEKCQKQKNEKRRKILLN